MKNDDRDIQILEGLLDKYKLVKPVPPEDQEAILASKKVILVRVLKTAGVFSAIYGAFLSIYFMLKKIGTGASIAKVILSGVAVASISYGGYYTVSSMNKEDASVGPSEKKALTLEDIRARYKWVDRITLYNGKVIQGAIIKRSEEYEVLTIHGVMRVPRNQIKMVKPLKISDDAAQPSKNGGAKNENK